MTDISSVLHDLQTARCYNINEYLNYHDHIHVVIKMSVSSITFVRWSVILDLLETSSFYQNTYHMWHAFGGDANAGPSFIHVCGTDGLMWHGTFVRNLLL